MVYPDNISHVMLTNIARPADYLATHADLSVVHISSPKGSHFAVVLFVVVEGVRGLSGQPHLRQSVTSVEQVTRGEHRLLYMFAIYQKQSRCQTDLVPKLTHKQSMTMSYC